MSEILKGQTLIIERVRTDQAKITPDMPREFVAQIPALSGSFDVGGKTLEITVCSPDSAMRQKIILEGELFPTTKKRGKAGQFARISGRRRVVSFPNNPKVTEVKHTVGPSEYVLFTRLPMPHIGGD